jgi:hypothetical protein
MKWRHTLVKRMVEQAQVLISRVDRHRDYQPLPWMQPLGAWGLSRTEKLRYYIHVLNCEIAQIGETDSTVSCKVGVMGWIAVMLRSEF